MLRNYFKTAWRSLLHNKVFSIINLAGLTVGLVCFMLLAIWLRHEMSYDRFHEKSDRLYMAYNKATLDNQVNCWESSPSPLGPALKAEFPEIDQMVRTTGEQFLFAYGKLALNGSCFITDSSFLSMFSFPLLQGDKYTALRDAHGVVITETFAKKMFGNENPMNKTVKINNTTNFTVTGVLKELPANTVFGFDYLLPWSFLNEMGWDRQYWGNNAFRTYVTLKPDASVDAVNKKIAGITRKHSGGHEKVDVFLYPLSQYHLHNKFAEGHPAGGRIEIVNLFIAVAFSILLIACINFMNLSTARSEKRAREVGVRKVVGAGKSGLVLQFLLESMLLAITSFVLAIVLVTLLLPAFSQLTRQQLHIDFAHPFIWLLGAGATLLTGLLAGSYPAFYLSSFKPIVVLKQKIVTGKASVTPRKVLVVTQFACSTVFIIATIVIYFQIRYAQNRDAGYNRDNIVYAGLSGQLGDKFDAVKNDLLTSGAAVAVCKTNQSLDNARSNSWGLNWPGKDPNANIVFDMMATTGDFEKTFDIKMTLGRAIDGKNFPTDSTACMLNESAVKAMGLKQPLGVLIDKDFVKWHVVGVFKDFVWGSPLDVTKPMMIEGADWSNIINIRLNPARSTQASLAAIGNIFKAYNPDYPFEYNFLDEKYARKFRDVQMMGTMAKLFAALTIFISCIGLLGLASFTAVQRSREIGIRKVLGASVQNIVLLLSKEFLWLIAIAFAVALPVAWYMMNGWLLQYNYRIGLSWWMFAAGGTALLLIAFGSVSYQAIRAAVTNPVKTLKTE
ncbi:ABC transporter permease [Deminuibacter soli]|uniref:ABC transporter permease n=1 Tax=Deminuibacter soli TaxID=2291815 RepID=A0A3E1ND79_9BACT|nr:ABC transporter permease [Deminuibacter soli]RFM25890.1 ABC transporter permease [Deminuibacter soli]